MCGRNAWIFWPKNASWWKIPPGGFPRTPACWCCGSSIRKSASPNPLQTASAMFAGIPHTRFCRWFGKGIMALSLAMKTKTISIRSGTILSFKWSVIAFLETASQPTLSRFVNAVSIPALNRLHEWMVEQFLGSFDKPPTRLMFDMDGFDDPAHGAQQLTLFDGYRQQNQYFPLIITNAETGLVVMISLRHGTVPAALGAEDDLEFLVKKVRVRWPDMDIEVRADSDFGVPRMYEVCERLSLWYTFGIGMNPRLKRESDDLLDEAKTRYEQTEAKQRMFLAFLYRAGGWGRERSVVIKAEYHRAGPNRRAVVTNRPGAMIVPNGVYDEYVQRGESENRNKELKVDVCGDRLSDHRFLANFIRLYLHAAALNLLILLRNQLPEANPKSRPRPAPSPDPDWPTPPTGSELRRAQPATWRLRLIKVATEVLVGSRRVLIRLSSAWPSLPTWRRVLHCVQQCSAETGAYCQARKRLPEKFFSTITRLVGRKLDDQAQESWLWKGHRVYRFDGSTVSMLDTAANQAAYPQTKQSKPGAGFPLARIGILSSLSCGAVLDRGLCSYAGKGTGEVSLLRRMWNGLRKGDVLLADGLMCNWRNLYELRERGIPVVSRLNKALRKADFRKGKRLGKDDHLVRWPKPHLRDVGRAQRAIPRFLTVREVRFRVEQAGFRTKEVIVVTTLLDPTEYSKEELVNLYRSRWSQELDFRDLKVTLQMDFLRCKTPELVRKEVWTHLLAFNLIRTVMAQAALKLHVLPRTLSFKGALQTLEAFQPLIAYVGSRSSTYRQHLYQELLDAISSHRVADRPDWLSVSLLRSCEERRLSLVAANREDHHAPGDKLLRGDQPG